MKLEKIILKNFRTYKESFEINFNNFTAIIGKNDIGKSSILEALDIFFNESAKGYTKIDKSDLNIDAEDSIIEISCTFSDFPEEIDLDAGNKTSLKKEYLLNQSGLLEIVKQYDTSLSQLKSKIFIRAYHPTRPDNVADLMKLKQAELKKRIEELNITDVNKNINSSMRDAIRNYYAKEIECNTTILEVDKEDSKKIIEKIKGYLPIYALFKSDRMNSDKESEIQDPISLATKKAIENELENLKKIQVNIQKEVENVAERTLTELKKFNENLASKLKLSIDEPKWDSLFKFSLDDENEIPINKRGSGIRRLVLLSFFKAEVEHKRLDLENDKPVIYAIEEPETSQHPNFQQMILESLIDISNISGNQVLITTHSPSFINYLDIENIRYMYLDKTNKIKACGQDDDCISKLYNDIFKDLGVMRNDKVKLIILVEGFSDDIYIRHFSKIFSEKYSEIKDLNCREDVAFLPFGGGNLKHWAERNYLNSFYPYDAYKFCIIDGDEGKYKTYCNKMLKDVEGHYFQLKKDTIENYISPTAIVKQDKYKDINIDALCVDADNPKLPKLLAKRVYENEHSDQCWENLSQDKKDKKVSKEKNNIRENILPTTTVEDIEGFDEGEVKELLIEISSKL